MDREGKRIAIGIDREVVLHRCNWTDGSNGVFSGGTDSKWPIIRRTSNKKHRRVRSAHDDGRNQNKNTGTGQQDCDPSRRRLRVYAACRRMTMSPSE